MKNFGKLSECAFNTDSFGHPEYAAADTKKIGDKKLLYVQTRGERHYSLKSPLFRWQSGDGSSVKTFRMGGSAGEGWAKDMAWALMISKMQKKICWSYTA